MRKICVLLVCAVMCLAFDSEAQFNRKQIKKNNKKISRYRGRKEHFGKEKIYNAVGISLNATNYYGDLAPKPGKLSTDFSFTRPGIGVSFGHRFGPRYTLMGQLMFATLRGDDAKSADPSNKEYNGRYLRNLHFRNNIIELSSVAVFDLFENMATYISRVKWTPYVFGGAAVFLNNPKAKAPEKDLFGDPLKEGGEWVNLRKLGTEGQHADLPDGSSNHGIKPYKLVQFAIPLGIGVRFRVNEVIDLWADYSIRYTFTDYLDDVSKNYVDLDVFGNDKLAQAMSYRTNEVPASERPAAYVPSGSSGILTVPGYGSEGTGNNVRGSGNEKDIYTILSIRATYILGATFHKAKFR